MRRGLVSLEKAGLIIIKKDKSKKCKAPLVQIVLDPPKVPVLQKEWTEREYH